MRWLSAVVLVALYLGAALVAAVGLQDAGGDVAEFASEGKSGLIIGLVLVAVVWTLLLPEFRGWLDDKQHRNELPRGEGSLNISVTAHRIMSTTGRDGSRWHATTPLLITNHSKRQMRLCIELRIMLRPDAGSGPYVQKPPVELASDSGLGLGGHPHPITERLLLEPHGHVDGYLAFRIDPHDLQARFRGDYGGTTSGQLVLFFDDELSEKTRSGGMGARLRKLH